MRQRARDAGGRTHQSQRPIRRRLLVAAGLSAAVAVLLIAPAAWLGVKASAISESLHSAAQLLPRLKSEILQDDAVSAAATVEELEAHTSNAREATGDPIWTIAAAMPWVGTNFQAVTVVATSADDIARYGAAPLVSVFGTLDWKALAPGPSGVDLQPLTAANAKLSSAAHAIRQSSDRLNQIDASALSPQVSEALIKARQELTAIQGGLETAADASVVVPEMMGENGKRRYLLLIQNNAEARASGGIPGALAVLSIDEGKMTLESQTSAGELGKFIPPVPIDPEQELIYSKRLGLYMQDVNLTPDFPTTASLAKSMWEKKRGQSLDGVISIDPVALSYLLNATGAVQLTDPELLALASGGLPTQLNSKNVVPTLLSDVYAKIADPGMQDAYFAGVAQKVFAALSSATSDPKKLLDGLTRGVDEGRVLAWSGNREEQAIISDYPLSGSISGPSVSPAQFGVYFNDGTGAKMDYYVKRRVKLIEECTSDEYSQVKVQITSTNTAPTDASSALPKYVTGGGALGVRAGTVQTNIVAYGPVQSHVESAAKDGIKTPFSAQRHNGRPVGTLTVKLAPGQSTTVEMTFDKIVQHAVPTLDVTPTVEPVHDVVLEPESPGCGPDL